MVVLKAELKSRKHTAGDFKPGGSAQCGEQLKNAFSVEVQMNRREVEMP